MVSKNILLEGLNQFYGANLAFNFNVNQDVFGKVIKHNTHDNQGASPFPAGDHKATRNRQDICSLWKLSHTVSNRSVPALEKIRSIRIFCFKISSLVEHYFGSHGT